MRMKPVLFNTDMVRAIQEGRKTVTRRVVKPQPREIYHGGALHEDDGDLIVLVEWENGMHGQAVSPYRPDDILYVRETWCINNITPHDPEWSYKADYDCTVKPCCNWKWHPSIHMPREAARIFLKVTEVGVQQVKDITDEEAASEGFASKSEFISVFLKIYPDCTEDSWCWVIRFERIEKPPL